MTQTFQFNFDDEASEREEVVIEKHNFQDKMNLSLRISYHHQPLFHFPCFTAKRLLLLLLASNILCKRELRMKLAKGGLTKMPLQFL